MPTLTQSHSHTHSHTHRHCRCRCRSFGALDTFAATTQTKLIMLSNSIPDLSCFIFILILILISCEYEWKIFQHIWLNCAVLYNSLYLSVYILGVYSMDIWIFRAFDFVIVLCFLIRFSGIIQFNVKFSWIPMRTQSKIDTQRENERNTENRADKNVQLKRDPLQRNNDKIKRFHFVLRTNIYLFQCKQHGRAGGREVERERKRARAHERYVSSQHNELNVEPVLILKHIIIFKAWANEWTNEWMRANQMNSVFFALDTFWHLFFFVCNHCQSSEHRNSAHKIDACEIWIGSDSSTLL